MAYSYRSVVRDQPFLLAPDLRDWLAVDHLVWQVIDLVGQIDTSMFHRRRGRRGSSASNAGQRGFDPDMLLVVLVYAYCVGVRSSRQIERACRTDIAFMIACAQDVPDHTVIARFRAEHESAFSAFFAQVLAVCAAAGMVKVGVVALDGTKIAANASMGATRTEATLRKMADEIIAEAKATDRAEDEADDQAGGGGGLVPESMSTHGRRLETIREALASIEAERAANPSKEMRFSLSRVATAEAALAKAVTGLRTYRAGRAAGEAAGVFARSGRRLKPVEATAVVKDKTARLAAARAAMAAKQARQPAKRRNLTDVASRLMKTRRGFVQGFNAQLVVSADHVIIACDVVTDRTDMRQFDPMIAKATEHLEALTHAGHERRIGVVLADAGYCSQANLTSSGPDRIIAVSKDRQTRDGTIPDPDTFRKDAIASMARRLKTDQGQRLYRQRGGIVEPVNGHIKQRRGLTQFARRGLEAARSELYLAAATTNLMRLITHQTPTPA